jgi:hypothetical protein
MSKKKKPTEKKASAPKGGLVQAVTEIKDGVDALEARIVDCLKGEDNPALHAAQQWLKEAKAWIGKAAAQLEKAEA